MASSTYSARSRRRRRSRPPVLVSYAPGNNQIRIVLVWALLVLVLMAIAGRLAWLQIAQGDALHNLAAQQRLAAPIERQVRHPIVDRQGNVIAVDRVVYTLYAHPRLFNRPIQDVATDLSPLLETPVPTLVGQLSSQPTGIRVVDGLPEETVDHIRALRLDGLELIPQQQRFYPQQELFAPIVGFVNLDGQPQAGLEIAYQDQLTLAPAIDQPPSDRDDPSKPPAPAIATEVYGPPLEALTPAAAVDPKAIYGPEYPVAEAASADEDADTTIANARLTPWEEGSVSLRLTLDSRLQRTAQQELEAAVKRHSAKGGAVMVMDAHSGEMLALASLPTYDPNQYFKADLNDLRNWAISDLYEPGSTFKPINIAIALEAGIITPDEMVNDSGQMQFGEWKIRNHDYDTVGGRGPISVTDVLKYSSNVGMVHIMQKMPAANYFDWLQRLSLDSPTGIDLPAEAAGQMKDREQFVRSRVELATTAFGQGFSMTPIKMLQLQAVLANGGKLVTPHVVSGMVTGDGRTLWTPDRPAEKVIFSPQTVQQVLTMMEAVVDSGTGSPAKLPGYRIGGKTGTAQKAAAGVYGRGRITSFVAILPINAPRYVVLAVIDEPQGENAYGSTVAAPLVKKITEALVVLEGVPPTKSP